MESRLLDSRLKEREELNEKFIESVRQEQKSVKALPEISKKSKQIIAEKGTYQPIYSTERLNEIIKNKKKNEERYKTNAANESKSKIYKPTVSNSKNNNKSKLCFDPKTIKSVIRKQNHQIRNMEYRESTEDVELRANCTFKPELSKKSLMLCSKKKQKEKLEQSKSEDTESESSEKERPKLNLKVIFKQIVGC